jgi:hypothetical protein
MQNIQDSAEMQKVEIDRYRSEIDAYNAETKRIAATQDNMTPEQIQDIVMNTIAAAMDTGDLIGGAPEMREVPEFDMQEAMQQPMQPEMQPDMGDMQEMPEMMPEQPSEGMM